MNEHVLINMAIRKPYNEHPDISKELHFNKEKGYWVKNEKPYVDVFSREGLA